MQPQAEPEREIDRQALCDLARARIDGLVGRVAFYSLGAAIGAIFVPALVEALCLGLIGITEFTERRAARSLLAADARGLDIAVSRRASSLAVTHIATAAAICLALATLWVFAGPAASILPLCLLAIAVLKVTQLGHQVLGLMMLRQVLYMGTAVAMTLRDITLMDAVTIQALAAGLLPVLLLASVVLSISYTCARRYREQLGRDHQLTEARDAAVEAYGAKSGFVATISHELRTPLNGVLGMAQTLLSTDLTPQQRQQAEVIAESGRTLNTLLNDILDYSKLEAGKLTIEPKPEDLRLTADHIARLYSIPAAEKGIEFEVTVVPELPERLVFDAVRVRQCLSNLVSNAVKFTRSGSVRVTISCETCEPDPDRLPCYIITAVVEDTGIGISADRQTHLFQPYSQADGSISRRFGGTGLGLSITRQLAESMGGTVTLESMPGEGSVFRLTFAAGKAVEAHGDQPHTAASSSLAEQRILIADDIETNRAVMRLFLQPLGVRVVEVADGTAALEALAGSKFDAALLDINMPGMGGTEIAARIRRGEGGRRDIPLLAVTADSVASSIDTSADGFDGVVIKPIDPRLLQNQLIGAILRRAGQRSQTPPDTADD